MKWPQRILLGDGSCRPHAGEVVFVLAAARCRFVKERMASESYILPAYLYADALDATRALLHRCEARRVCGVGPDEDVILPVRLTGRVNDKGCWFYTAAWDLMAPQVLTTHQAWEVVV